MGEDQAGGIEIGYEAVEVIQPDIKCNNGDEEKQINLGIIRSLTMQRSAFLDATRPSSARLICVRSPTEPKRQISLFGS